METLLEQQRRYHEERERLMDAMVQERLINKASHRDSINSEHRQRAMIDRSNIFTIDCIDMNKVLTEGTTNALCHCVKSMRIKMARERKKLLRSVDRMNLPSFTPV